MAEKEYIEREAALSAQNKSMNLAEMRKRLERIPAADVRPVVLCRDCKMANPCSDDREIYCTLIHCYRGIYYFCADGRMEEDDD